MHRISSIVSIAAVVAVAGIVTGASTRNESVDAREIARLRAHFATVLGELRAADVSNLSASQRAARTVLIERLEDYAAAGRFPHNHVVRDRFVPVFRDEHGTLCAMGYLVASTGRTDIVDDVARTNNLALIPQLASDARLVAWLDSTGITVNEAARIQPMYGPGRCLCFRPDTQPTATAAERQTPAVYFLGSGAAMALNVLSLKASVAPGHASPRAVRRNAVLGMAAGAGQIVLGALTVGRSDVGSTIGIANMTVGVAAFSAAAWRLRHPPQQLTADLTRNLAAGRTTDPTADLHAELTPNRLGVRVQVRF